MGLEKMPSFSIKDESKDESKDYLLSKDGDLER